MQNGRKLLRMISIALITVLAVNLVSLFNRNIVEAKTSRIAKVNSIKGVVTIKKSGGSKSFKAFKNMTINQGDHISVEYDSALILQVGQRAEDEITFGENTKLYISELVGDDGKVNKTKLKLFAGSSWSNISKLKSDDEYEIETPTAVMGVRGTKVLTSVDSKTGKTYIAVAAGLVKVAALTDDEESMEKKNDTKEVLIYPSQQISLDSRNEVDDLSLKVGIVNMEDLVDQTSSEIIEAIVKDKQDIDRENAEFIADQKEKLGKGDPSAKPDTGSLHIKDQSDLDKVQKNLDNLIGNIVKTAIDTNKVEKVEIDKVIEQINQQITDPSKKLDLDKVTALDQTAGIDAEKEKKKQEKLAELEADKKKKQDEEKKKQEEAKAKLAEVLKTLEASKKAIEEENKKAAAEAQVKAEAQLKAELDETAKKAFDDTQKKLQDVYNEQEGNKVPTTDSNSGTTMPIKTKPVVKVTSSSAFDAAGKLFTLKIALNHFTGSNAIKGLQINIVYDAADFKLNSIPEPLFRGEAFNSTSVANVEEKAGTVNGITKKELIYTVINLSSVPANVISTETELVNLPMKLLKTGVLSPYFTITVKAMNQSGEVITVDVPSFEGVQVQIPPAVAVN